jgi:hypothetical protein
MPFTDPFNLAYAAIWDALEAYAPWSAAVSPGNRVDLEAPGAPVRRVTRRSSGLPQDKRGLAELDQTAFKFVYSVNSRCSGVAQTFTLYLSDEARGSRTLIKSSGTRSRRSCGRASILA